MPRNEPMPGWGVRIMRVRVRMNLSKKAFAALFGVTDSSYAGWETRHSGTSVVTLKRGLVALGIPDVDRTLSWLADGDGPEPHWLRDEPGTTPSPRGPTGIVAMPQAALDACREAFVILDGKLAAGEIRDSGLLRAHLALERFNRNVDDAMQAQEQPQAAVRVLSSAGSRSSSWLSIWQLRSSSPIRAVKTATSDNNRNTRAA